MDSLRKKNDLHKLNDVLYFDCPKRRKKKKEILKLNCQEKILYNS